MDIFVARQPIFDVHMNVMAYELLFRSSQNNFYSCDDPDFACSRVISDELHVFGLDNLLADKLAFVNITRRVLVEQLVHVLPVKRTVVELLETIEPDDEVIAAVTKLKRAGYTIALDDFVYHPNLEPLIELADIVKIDFVLAAEEERVDAARRFAPQGIELLAEKVETREEFAQAVEWGYTYFQGYFFRRPEMLQRKDIPAFKGNYLRLLQALNEPNLNFQKIGSIVKQEVSLSVKLLRYLNSTALGLRRKVKSIREALVLMGERPFKRWASLLALAGLGDDKPQELIVTSLVRARFCESLAEITGFERHRQDLFIVGLFSTVDALVGRPLDEILEELSLSQPIREALAGADNVLGRVYKLVLACEQGDYEEMMRRAESLHVTEPVLADLYAKALAWTKTVFNP